MVFLFYCMFKLNMYILNKNYLLKIRLLFKKKTNYGYMSMFSNKIKIITSLNILKIL